MKPPKVPVPVAGAAVAGAAGVPNDMPPAGWAAAPNEKAELEAGWPKAEVVVAAGCPKADVVIAAGWPKVIPVVGV